MNQQKARPALVEGMLESEKAHDIELEQLQREIAYAKKAEKLAEDRERRNPDLFEPLRIKTNMEIQAFLAAHAAKIEAHAPAGGGSAGAVARWTDAVADRGTGAARADSATARSVSPEPRARAGAGAGTGAGAGRGGC